ncbi:MAG: hypothetical protein IT442_11010 [Phycisphaeraceae bacterium]|nr:hypothetical protein [Phycisphaeraceae bacterium]
MKRWMRRVVVSAVGLGAGWYCAGWVQEAAWAEHGPAEAAVHAEEAGAAEGAGGHAGGAEAAGLVPGGEHEASLPGWYGGVVWGAAGLFGAGIVVGVAKKREQGQVADGH